MNRKRNIRIIITIGLIVIVGAAAGLFLTQRKSSDYTPTTLANVHRAAKLPACLQPTKNTALIVPKDDDTYIANNVATSIIDVQAGTNVDAYYKTYTGTESTGTAVYSGKSGSYNFTAKKVADNSTNNYTGGWKITKLEACQR